MTQFVIVVVTPFHLRQLYKLTLYENFNENGKGLLIFYSEYIDLTEIKQRFPLAKLVKLPFGSLKIKDLAKPNIFKTIISLRKKKEEVFNLCDLYIEKKSVKLIIYTEKEYFSQCLLWFFKKKCQKSEVIYVEEGIGSYIDSSFRDKIKNCIYLICSIITLGFPYRYFRTLGTHPDINKYYSRLPEYLPNKKDNIKYITLHAEKNIDVSKIKLASKVVILTAPIPDKITFLNNLSKLLREFNLEPIVKPHPREDIGEYDHLEAELLNPKLSSEDLDYENYFYIINFYSSGLIDIFSRGYPLNHVITFKVRLVKSKLTFYERTSRFDDLNSFKRFLLKELG